MMTSERFQELAGAYGGDIRRWPGAERVTAQAYLAATPGARAVLDAEAQLDAFLGASGDPRTNDLLLERIVRQAPRPTLVMWRRGSAWMSGAGLAAACVLGIMVGANVSAGFLEDPAADTVVEASTAFDGTDYFDDVDALGENAG